MFDTPAQIKRQAPQIMAQAVKTHTMPLGNVTEITEAERSALGSWIVCRLQAELKPERATSKARRLNMTNVLQIAHQVVRTPFNVHVLTKP